MPNLRPFSYNPLHPDTISWQSRVNEVGGRVAQKTLMHTDRLIKYCYSVGLRDVTGASHKLKFWLPLATDGFEGLFVPIWHPTVNTICTNVNFVSADYSLSNGLQGNGTSKYINSLVNTSLFPDSVYLAAHSSSDTAANSYAIAAGDDTIPVISSLTIKWSDNLGYFEHKEPASLAASVVSSIGLFAGFRISGQNYFYQNENQLATNAVAANPPTLPSRDYYLFAWNSNNFPLAISARRLCCFFMGDNITPPQHEAFVKQQSIWDTSVRTS